MHPSASACRSSRKRAQTSGRRHDDGCAGSQIHACAGGSASHDDAQDGMSLQVKGRAAQLKHPLNAHTDGDTFVYFADANVISTGDTVAMNRYPNIDFANGGSLKGMIAATDAYLSLTNDTTKIVPGHGPLATKAQLAEYRAMLSTVRDR